MAAALTVNNIIKNAAKGFLVVGTVVFSGNYSTGGDALDLRAISGLPIQGRDPVSVTITGKAGFIYQYDLANRKVFVYTNTAGGANAALGEHTAAAVVAGVTGDVIKLEAVYA